MQKETIKFQSSTVFEGMTSIRAILRGIDAGVNERRIDKILYDTAKMSKIHKEVGYLKAVSEKYGFTVVESSADELEDLTLGSSHGGIIAITGDRPLPYLSDARDIPEGGFFVMIEGIEDPYNFGYALRSMYAMGCDGVILSERNWMSAAGVVARSSAGASETFRIFKAEPEAAAVYFKNLGYKIVCADENTDNLLGKTDLKCPILLIVGGEKRGISKKVLEHADVLVKIDYAREFRASLSAASAATMFAYEIARQNPKNS